VQNEIVNAVQDQVMSPMVPRLAENTVENARPL
jgi:hypothetical protein